MESSVYKNIISTPLRCLIAGRRPGAQLAVNRDRRSRPPAPPSGWLRCRAAREPGSLYPKQRPAMQSIATGSAKLLRQTVSDRAPFSAHSRLEETGRPTPPPAEGRYFSLTLERPPLAPASFQKRYLSARTLRMFYWPADCNLHCPRAGGNRSNNSWLFGRFPTPAVARGDFNRFCLRKTVEIPL